MSGTTFDLFEVVTDLNYKLQKYRPDPNVEGLSDEERDRRKALADLQWEGTIPEPSDDDIERLFNQELPAIRLVSQRALAELLEKQEAGRLEWWKAQQAQQPAGADLTPPSRDALFELQVPSAMLDAEQAEYTEALHTARLEQRERTYAAVAAFCHESPPRQVLEALPWRAFQHFQGWLTGQFRPETLAAAMNA